MPSAAAQLPFVHQSLGSATGPVNMSPRFVRGGRSACGVPRGIVSPAGFYPDRRPAPAGLRRPDATDGGGRAGPLLFSAELAGGGERQLGPNPAAAMRGIRRAVCGARVLEGSAPGRHESRVLRL